MIYEIGKTKEVAERYNREIGRVGYVYPNIITEIGCYCINPDLEECQLVEVSDGGHFYYEI